MWNDPTGLKRQGELIDTATQSREAGEPEVGRFGHHPDPEIDACVEIERLRGLLCEAHAGLLRALDYRAATPAGLGIKRDVRDALRRTGFDLAAALDRLGSTGSSGP